jgi:chloramphenicol 3-O-phosphotransferase
MKLIFIYGPAASGKLTVAKALCALTGLRLFHNHLVVDTLLSVFQFGSPEFVELREKTWLGVFAAAARSGISLAFTFAPEVTVRPEFIANTLAAVGRAGGEVCFVELRCPIAELERRIDAPSRHEWMKLKSVEVFRQMRVHGADSFPPLPTGLVIDTGTTPPEQAAQLIASRYHLAISNGTPRDPYSSTFQG